MMMPCCCEMAARHHAGALPATCPHHWHHTPPPASEEPPAPAGQPGGLAAVAEAAQVWLEREGLACLRSPPTTACGCLALWWLPVTDAQTACGVEAFSVRSSHVQLTAGVVVVVVVVVVVFWKRRHMPPL